MNAMSELDQRIERDLAERLNGKRISSAVELEKIAHFSSLGLPMYYTGNRDAQTVFVQLNPGMNTDIADERWDFDTKCFSKENFVEDYKESLMNYGLRDRFRYDSFDVKQAAFLCCWHDREIGFPENIDWDPIKDKRPNKTKEEKAKDKEVLSKLKGTSWLYAKECVLQNKLQLELIPYASQNFEIKDYNHPIWKEYIENLLDEIFRVPRTYVIFGGDVFDKLFSRFQDIFIDVTEKLPIDSTELKKVDGTDLKTHLYYKVIEIHYKENNPQIALIAHTFPNQALGNAFNIMYEYGKQCYKNLNPYLSKENQ